MDHSIWGLCWSPLLWKTTMSGILNAEMICGRGYVGIVRECRVIGVLLQMQCQTCSPLLPYKYSLSPNCYVCSCSAFEQQFVRVHHVGGCQNYGPFWVPFIILKVPRCPAFLALTSYPHIPCHHSLRHCGKSSCKASGSETMCKFDRL